MPRKKLCPPHQSQAKILNLIVERYQRRTAWHKAEKSLTLQGRAICRRLCDGDKDRANELFDGVAELDVDEIGGVLAGFTGELTEPQVLAVLEVHPILVARHTIGVCRTGVERELEKLVKQLPIAAFFERPEMKGASYGSLAALIGCAGNLHNYATVQRLWKRMGMAVMPNGRQRQLKDPDQAKLHGYSPERRSVAWNVGTSVLRTQSVRFDKKTGEIIRESGPYRKLYEERKAYETAKNEAGDYADQAAKRLSEAKFGPKTAAIKAYTAGKLPPMHLHARAQRYMEKRILRELWGEWQRTMEKPEAPALEPEAADELAA
jgi:hypothetical protein